MDKHAGAILGTTTVIFAIVAGFATYKAITYRKTLIKVFTDNQTINPATYNFKMPKPKTS